MKRTLKQWSGMQPDAVAAGSNAQIIFCIADAQHDIRELSDIIRLLLEELDDPCRRNQREYGPVWLSKPLEVMARKVVI
jgi:hypothetical protein